ncbi:pyridoxamine 5'-phosphate oxidase family protein [Paracoccus sp. TK19116]|uniref:Pyridoxamine 5'-phosphate oxidase family protein n=1 Tax=Paracoccus albicereus TaxID=2922394 RepID=A0ABT1MWT5_9RHOB|nr:pyridoxamine 5'-phosphate oxidase family protein [Paracoccus albicereus]MCQ0971793.1 pyridoxamine 5'-phosphate oxidase family protein [Paracoccus albicereus]
MADHDEKFWDRLDDINAGMLGLKSDARFIPMSHYAERDERALWFITAKGTDLVDALQGGAQEGIHLVSDGGEGLYARVSGRLALSDDRAKLDELWNAVASSWFEDGKQDPDVQLVRMDLTDAEVWATGGKVSFLYEIAKSKVTGSKPDMGEHYTLSF